LKADVGVTGAEPNATVFVGHLRNRTGALSPRSRNGALRQFVSKAGLATPELALLAVTAVGSPSGRPRPIAEVETAVLTPTKFYERRAKEAFRPLVGLIIPSIASSFSS